MKEIQIASAPIDFYKPKELPFADVIDAGDPLNCGVDRYSVLTKDSRRPARAVST